LFCSLAFTGLSKFQIMSEGGPQPQSIIHFSISNQTVAVVNRRGQVTGKSVGTAVLHGTIQTVNEDTGKVIVFSQVSLLYRFCSRILG
jgi:nuclear pore complex protein Nup210